MIGTRRSTWVRVRPLRLELLERRDQPSAGLRFGTVLPDLQNQTVTPAASGSFLYGLTPAMVRNAYGFNQLGLDGSGQTIAIVSAFHHPTVQDDLETFNRTFGLPGLRSFSVVSSPGTPNADRAWAIETALDVQWAHAVAPGANIVLVQARSDRLGDMLDAVDQARNYPGVTAVSMSWGLSEFNGQGFFDRLFTAPNGHDGVSFVAASGDSGAAAGAMWPASAPNVLAVGGTRLTVDANGNYVGETAWTNGGGGYSRVLTSRLSHRPLPDVSYAADPSNGFFVYTSDPAANSRTGWFTVGGTSAGAPQWAGIIAVANQGRELIGLAPIANARAAISQLSDSAFHDVTTGSNGHAATVGFDLATGRGSPKAPEVVAQLMGKDMPTQVPFVGPLPDASKLPRQSARVPGRMDGAFAQIAADAAKQQATHFNVDNLTRPDFRFDRGNQASERSELPTPLPILVAPTVPLSAVDLSEWGMGDPMGEELIVPPAVPVPDGEAKPAARYQSEPAPFILRSTSWTTAKVRDGWNIALGQCTPAEPQDIQAIVTRSSASMVFLAFLTGGMIRESNRREQKKPSRR